jgi:PEP-CTERM/exosortase A-associated glycosyltransferase
MRVLHVLDHSLPLHSGYTFRTLSILREQRALGWETFHLTTPRHGPTSADVETIDGWTFHRTPLHQSMLGRIPAAGKYISEIGSTVRRLRTLIAELKPDIVHAHSPVLNALPALHVARQLGLPVVYEVRALWEDGAVDHGTTRTGSVRYHVSRMLETFALRRANRVTTICEGLRREIAGRGVESGRIVVIPNGVDCEQFAYDPSPDHALIERLQLRDTVNIGFIGSFYGYEGLELLVQAFAESSRRRPELRLLFVGGGPREAAMRALVDERGLDGKVIFSGRVPHIDVQKYYSVCDLMVYPRLPTRVTELVTPLKPLEAMAQGRLVLVSDVGGHKELVSDGQTGYMFAAGQRSALVSRLEGILDDRGAWAAIRQRARRFVETERSWKSSVARYGEVYRGALKSAAAA